MTREEGRQNLILLAAIPLLWGASSLILYFPTRHLSGIGGHTAHIAYAALMGPLALIIAAIVAVVFIGPLKAFARWLKESVVAAFTGPAPRRRRRRPSRP